MVPTRVTTYLYEWQTQPCLTALPLYQHIPWRVVWLYFFFFFPSYKYQQNSSSLNDPEISDYDPGWLYFPSFLSSLWVTICQSCWVTVHIRWWCGLKHQLTFLQLHISMHLGTHRFLLAPMSDFIYNSILWHSTSIFGFNFTFHPLLLDSDCLLLMMNPS